LLPKTVSPGRLPSPSNPTASVPETKKDFGHLFKKDIQAVILPTPLIWIQELCSSGIPHLEK
jgi:hypothetical protein